MIMLKLLTIIQFILLRTIKCDTIHFTNSPNYLMQKQNYTTYKLQVPGSNSITIIEANTDEPLKNSEIFDNTNQDNNDGTSKKTVYAPNLLEKFMTEYNIKVSSNLPPGQSPIHSEINNQSRGERYSSQYLDEIVNHSEDEYQNRPDNNYYHQQYQGPGEYENSFTTNQNSYAVNHFNSLNDDRKTPNKNDKNWISLEPIPWSKAQVSKWKPNAEIEPINAVSGLSVFDNRETYKMPINKKWTTNMDHKPNYYDQDRTYIAPNHMENPDKDYAASNIMEIYEDRKTSKPNYGPLNSKPKPTKNKYYSINNNYDKYDKPEIEVSPNHDRWYDYGYRPDLTLEDDHRDDRKPNPFSSSYQEDIHKYDNKYDNKYDDSFSSESAYSSTSVRPKKSKPYGIKNGIFNNQNRNFYNSGKDRHPTNHPVEGNGEWVLMSTTKGYQRPLPSKNNVPRGIHYDKSNSTSVSANEKYHNPPVTNFRTHKSIKLTVLPPKSNKPMVVSHNGLIEVEGSPQTVEDSALAELTKKKVVKRRAKPVKLVPMALNNQNNDKSAVLAAIGAGMVPATMAMVMPMVLGRRKRSLNNYQRNETLFHENNNDSSFIDHRIIIM